VIEPVCGNGVLEMGEECDDGDTVAGDGCAPTCVYERIPGNRSGSTHSDPRACLTEFSVRNPGNTPATDKRGRPSYVQTCRNDDPTCDFDLDPDAPTCEFHVAVCLNNVDANLSGCVPTGVASSMRVVRPNWKSDGGNYNRVLAALQDLRNPATGVTGLAPPVSPADANLCSAPFSIRVPLRGGTSKAKVILRTLSESVLTEPRITKDKDQVMLVCTP